MLEIGDVIPRNVAKARGLYGRTCAGGVAADCYSLGRLLQRNAATSDPKAALEAFSSGCTGGSAPACHELGVASEGARDAKKALGFFQKACSAGHAPACITWMPAASTGASSAAATARWVAAPRTLVARWAARHGRRARQGIAVAGAAAAAGKNYAFNEEHPAYGQPWVVHSIDNLFAEKLLTVDDRGVYAATRKGVAYVERLKAVNPERRIPE